MYFNFHLTSQKSMAALRTLGILETPFSESELKHKFRDTIKLCHEDKGGNKNDSQKIIDAYNYLKPFAVSETPKETARRIRFEIQTEIENDMFALYRDCIRCNGTGNEVYTVKIKKREQKKVRICPNCRGIGKIEVNVFNPVIPKGAVL